MRQPLKSKHRHSKQYRDIDVNHSGSQEKQKIRVFEGWNYRWKSPKQKSKNTITVHTVVPGPFSKPALIKPSPYVVLESYPGDRGKYTPGSYCVRHRGIPNSWLEYLAWKEFGDDYEKELAKVQMNLGYKNLRVTDHLWNDRRIFMGQGIPDPWKNMSLAADSSTEESSEEEGEIDVPTVPLTFHGGCQCAQRNVVQCPDDIPCPFASVNIPRDACNKSTKTVKFDPAATKRRNITKEKATDISELNAEPNETSNVQSVLGKSKKLHETKKKIRIEKKLPDDLSALKFVCSNCNCPYLKVSRERRSNISDEFTITGKEKNKRKSIMENFGDIVLGRSPGLKKSDTIRNQRRKSKDNLFEGYGDLVVRKASEAEKSGNVDKNTVINVKRKPRDVSEKRNDIVRKSGKKSLDTIDVETVYEERRKPKEKIKKCLEPDKGSLMMSQKLPKREAARKLNQLEEQKKGIDIKSTTKASTIKPDVKAKHQHTVAIPNKDLKRSRKADIPRTDDNVSDHSKLIKNSARSVVPPRTKEKENLHSCGCENSDMDENGVDMKVIKKNKNQDTQDQLKTCYPCGRIPNFEGISNCFCQSNEELETHSNSPSGSDRYGNLKRDEKDPIENHNENNNISTNDMVMPFEKITSPEEDTERESGGADGDFEKVMETLFERRYKFADGNLSECSERNEYDSCDERLMKNLKRGNGKDPSCYLKHCNQSVSSFRTYDKATDGDMFMRSISDEES